MNIARELSVGEAISRLLEHPTRTLTGLDLQALGPIGEFLQNWGAFDELEPLKVIRCRACDEDHEVDLEFDRGAGAYVYYCGSAGLVRAGSEDVRVFRFGLEWLMASLSTGLRISRPRYRELVTGVLWDLGDAALGDRPWAAFIARAVLVNFDSIFTALQTRGRKIPGLVFTSSADAPWSILLPHRYRFVPLGDVLEVQTETLGVMVDEVLRLLRGQRTAPPIRKRGRPTDRGIVLEVFERRLRDNQTEWEVKQEAEAIGAELVREEELDLQGTAVGTIENIIRGRHRAWRKAHPRATK